MRLYGQRNGDAELRCGNRALWRFWMAITCAGLLVGCSQKLVVRAELLQFPAAPEAKTALDSAKARLAQRNPTSTESLTFRVAQTVVWTSRAMKIIEETCRENYAQTVFTGREQELTNEKWKGIWKPGIDNYARFYNDWKDLQELNQKASDLLARIQKGSSLPPNLPEMIKILDEGKVLAEKVAYVTGIARQKDAIAAFATKMGRDNISLMETIAGKPATEEVVTSRLLSESGGFGGLATYGVFEIRPGDSLYQYVLGAKAYPDPLSSASTTAGGESTVVFVQESPAQFRVKEISNDPSKIVQNVIAITNMALRAAAQAAAGF
jgi:hypothetical protein